MGSFLWKFVEYKEQNGFVPRFFLGRPHLLSARIEVNAPLFPRIPRLKNSTADENSTTPRWSSGLADGLVRPKAECARRDNDSTSDETTTPCSLRSVLVMLASCPGLAFARATPRSRPLSNGSRSLVPPPVSNGTAASWRRVWSRKIAVPPIDCADSTSAQPVDSAAAVPAVSMVLAPPTGIASVTWGRKGLPSSFQKLTVNCTGTVSVLTSMIV